MRASGRAGSLKAVYAADESAPECDYEFTLPVADEDGTRRLPGQGPYLARSGHRPGARGAGETQVEQSA
jgi:hypothetical protein